MQFTDAAVESLAAYPWPGNVRELRNFVERSFILSGKDVVDVDDLPATIAYGASRAEGDLALESAVKDHILKVLDLADGNKKRAAELLGIDRSTLYAKLSAFGKEAGPHEQDE